MADTEYLGQLTLGRQLITSRTKTNNSAAKLLENLPIGRHDLTDVKRLNNRTRSALLIASRRGLDH